MRLRLIAAVVLAASVGATPAYASHKKPPAPSTPTTYDVSYPQCGGALPADIDGGIVGVNGGRVYSANPCLATEWAWAVKATPYAPALYANTANPGPAYSSYWPKAGTTYPRSCDASNSVDCSYDYGWNAAKDSFADAQSVIGSAGGYVWWLDVETGNSWETLESAYGQNAISRANDTAALQGAVDSLVDSGVGQVGIYSTSYQWGQITGGTGTQFHAQPVWVAGTGSLSTAQSNCTTTSFTSGPITLAQYAKSGYDADYHC